MPTSTIMTGRTPIKKPEGRTPERTDEVRLSTAQPSTRKSASSEDSWYFDFCTPDAVLAGYARLTVRHDAAQGRQAWWWCAVVGEDVPFVLVKDLEVDRPRGRSLEIRSSGLWAEATCEIPGEHWSLGLEAFGVCLDDPTEAYRSERGDLIPLGFDLEWTAEAEAGATADGAQPCLIDGDVLLGRQRWSIEARGMWQFQSGERDWSAGDWSWRGGHAVDPLPVDDHGLLVDALYHAPLLVGTSRLARALTPERVWAERLQPASSALG